MKFGNILEALLFTLAARLPYHLPRKRPRARVHPQSGQEGLQRAQVEGPAQQPQQRGAQI